MWYVTRYEDVDAVLRDPEHFVLDFRKAFDPEALKRTLVDRIRAAFPRTAVTNVYGPTETTIDSTFFPLDGFDGDLDDIAIL